ncbi:M23 family metallopeptidase [Bifidobacterium goeldii]|nr:M23 family metallopeptidase [Bifidobacterium goeldii]
MSDLICAQSAAASTEPAGCTQLWTWPIASARVLAVFDPPAQNWLPGHRGIDLAANTGTALIAPSHGTIAFAGSVGGKSVVSIRHGTLTSTFEPAITDRAVGDTVSRGEMFATVSGESDHCADECVHWGLKRPDANIHSRYIDPAYRVQQSRVALKPVPTV